MQCIAKLPHNSTRKQPFPFLNLIPFASPHEQPRRAILLRRKHLPPSADPRIFPQGGLRVTAALPGSYIPGPFVPDPAPFYPANAFPCSEVESFIPVVDSFYANNEPFSCTVGAFHPIDGPFISIVGVKRSIVDSFCSNDASERVTVDSFRCIADSFGWSVDMAGIHRWIRRMHR